MPIVTYKQLHAYCHSGGYKISFKRFDKELRSYDQPNPLDQATYLALKKCDLKVIMASYDANFTSFTGKDMTDIAIKTAKAVNQYYRIATWNGPGYEVMIVGYKPYQLDIKGSN